MKYLRLIILAFAFLGTMPLVVHAQGAGIGWDTLNQEATELSRARPI